MALLVLADTALDPEALREFEALVGPVLCNHLSGRPWIVGDPGPGGLTVVPHPRFRVAVVGHSGMSAGGLEALVRNVTGVDGLSSVADRVVDFDVLLLAHDGQRLRAFAPPFQTRSLFWTRTHGTTVVSDGQHPLAALNGFEVDRSVLVSRIVNAEVSYPFLRRPVWQGVDALGTGESLRVDASGTVTRLPWWTPPTAGGPVRALAPVLTAGIAAALDRRTAGRREVSADLSGGLDSTTLSFFLAEQGLPLSTLFLQVENRTNNDWRWADRAAAELGSRHLRVPYASVVDDLSHQVEASVARFPEGPGAFSTSIASAAPLAERLAVTGSTLHLNGHAGDALFGQVSSAVWSYYRARGWKRYRWLHRYRVMNRIPLSAMVALLADNRTFAAELAALERGDARTPRHDTADHASWIQAPRFGGALTPDAREEFARLVRAEAGDGARPLSDDRTTHQILGYLSAHGAVVRRMNAVGTDVQFDSPYLDRGVVEPALALDHVDRAVQNPTKPLLAAARPAGMSLDYFLRRDKGDYTAEVFDQHRSVLARANRLFSEGSLLAGMGLVDDADARRIANAYSPDGSSHTDVVELEFAERWLRDVQSARSAAPAESRST